MFLGRNSFFTRKAVGGSELWAWGRNDFGQLGLGNTTRYYSPKQIGLLSTWVLAGAGVYSSSARSLDGNLWAWGQNSFGKLGLGNTTAYSSPVQVGALTNWQLPWDLGIGGNFSVAVKTDGTLWTCGYNNVGQLGLGNTTNYSSPKQVGALTGWSKASGGSRFVLAVKTDGTLWTWGQNDVGQLGDGTTTNRNSPVQIGSLTTWANVGAGYGCNAVKTDGTLWVWGTGTSGQTGLGNTTNYSSPKQVGALTNWAFALSANNFSIANKTDGTLWSWGNNSRGQLGLGNTTSYSSPKQVGALTGWSTNIAPGYNFSSALKTDGTLWTWGRGNFGLLGFGNTTDYSSPKQVGSLTTWTGIAASNAHILATKTTATPIAWQLWAWGPNATGQAGLGNTTVYSSPKQVGALTTWLKVSNSSSSALNGMSAGIKTDGTLWTWGSNNSGQLGLGNTTNYSSPKQVGALTTWSKVSTGNKFIAAIKTDGTLWTWGYNSYGSGGGALGLGNITNYSSPKQVGSLTTWASVAASANNTAAIKTDRTLWTWGWNASFGALGLGDVTNRSSPVQVGSLTNWYRIAGGVANFFAVKTDGTLWDWGRNAAGSLGLGNTTYYSSPKQVGALTNWSKAAAGQAECAAIKTDGTLWTWGTNGSGRLGLGNTTSYSSPKQVGALTNWSRANISDVTTGLKKDGTLWTWGSGDNGKLGLGNVTNYSSPVQVGALTTWTAIAEYGYSRYSSLAIKS